MDVTGLPSWLYQQGPIGVAILVLLAVIVYQQRRIDTVTEARIGDLKNIIAAMHAGITAATEAMKLNSIVQDRAGITAGALGEAIRSVEKEIERLREMIEQMQEALRALERGGRR